MSMHGTYASELVRLFATPLGRVSLAVGTASHPWTLSHVQHRLGSPQAVDDGSERDRQGPPARSHPGQAQGHDGRRRPGRVRWQALALTPRAGRNRRRGESVVFVSISEHSFGQAEHMCRRTVMHRIMVQPGLASVAPSSSPARHADVAPLDPFNLFAAPRSVTSSSRCMGPWTPPSSIGSRPSSRACPSWEASGEPENAPCMIVEFANRDCTERGYPSTALACWDAPPWERLRVSRRPCAVCI